MKRGVAHDLGERARIVDALPGSGGIFTNISTTRGEHRAGGLSEIAGGEHMRRQQILGEDDQLRPDHRGEHAAGQDPGHDFRPERFAGGIGGGEAVGIVRGGIEPAAERADQQQPELAVHHRRIGNQPGQNAEHRSGLQREAPAEAAGERAHRQRAEPHADHHGGDRQRRQALVGRQHRADDRGGRNDDGVVAAGQRLRHRQHHGVAARQAVVDGAVKMGSATADMRAFPAKRIPLLAAFGEYRHCGRRRAGSVNLAAERAPQAAHAFEPSAALRGDMI